MNIGFTYEKVEEYEGYVVFDDSYEPILETFDYIKTLGSLNTKKNAAVTLSQWFTFLYQKGIEFNEVETKHIPEFNIWLKTPPEHRGIRKVLNTEEHTIASTRMKYQSRVAHFYEQYVKPKYPECKINFKEKTSGSAYDQERLIFREKPTFIEPIVKAISVETFLTIKECCTNERDKLILELVYKSGIRRGELFNIHIDQFDHISRGSEHPAFAMYIHDSYSPNENKQTKTGSREVLISTGLAEKIKGYIRNTVDGRVVNKNKHYEIFTAMQTIGGTKKGDPLSGAYIWKIFKNAATKAGFPQYTIHDCRHSYVTNMFSQKVNIKDTMDQTGHKNPETLFKYRSKLDEYPIEVLQAIKEMDAQLNRQYQKQQTR